jgi:SAM-dependent methyltransferase
MKTKTGFLGAYVAMAPLALAFERSLECGILSKMPLARPILDIGCGDGLFAKILFAEKVETGVDPNSRELERARELGAYETLIECTGDRIPRSDASYRTVFSNSVLEHIPELEPVLREARRLLAPGGFLYITVPTDRFSEYTILSYVLGLLGLLQLQRRFRAFFDHFWAHHHCYAPQDWARLLQATGFEVQVVQPYDPRHLCMINDFLVAASIPAFITKKLANRWTLMPALRRIFLAPIIALMQGVLRKAENSSNGGLVFLAARKP